MNIENPIKISDLNACTFKLHNGEVREFGENPYRKKVLGHWFGKKYALIKRFGNGHHALSWTIKETFDKKRDAVLFLNCQNAKIIKREW